MFTMCKFLSQFRRNSNICLSMKITLRRDTLDIKEEDYYESLYNESQSEFNTCVTPFVLLQLFFYLVARSGKKMNIRSSTILYNTFYMKIVLLSSDLFYGSSLDLNSCYKLFLCINDLFFCVKEIKKLLLDVSCYFWS